MRKRPGRNRGVFCANDGSYSSPCAFGISWVGRICGAGLDCPVIMFDGGAAAGFVSTAADCCDVSADLPAVAGFEAVTGALRVATCGSAGGGAARITFGGGSAARAS
jgi:hypothetical protein